MKTEVLRYKVQKAEHTLDWLLEILNAPLPKDIVIGQAYTVVSNAKEELRKLDEQNATTN